MESSQVEHTVSAHVIGVGRPVTFRNGIGHVLEVIAGETVILPLTVTGVTEVAKPQGATVTLEDGVLTLSAVGRYHLRAATESGVEVDLSFVVCQQAAHDWIPLSRPGRPGFTDRRAVLRGLGKYEATRFDGTQASMLGINLTAFGG